MQASISTSESAATPACTAILREQKPGTASTIQSRRSMLSRSIAGRLPSSSHCCTNEAEGNVR